MTTEKKYKFLIIDDHPFFREGVKNFLISQSEFECLGDFSECRSLLNTGNELRPDFILLDLNIPGLDGRISCGLLKKKYPNCKVIALTQYSNLHQKLRELQFDGYIEKNNSNGLLDAIRNVLKGEYYFIKQNENDVYKTISEDQKDDYLKSIKLTPREIEIILLVVEGLSNPEIAAKLNVSEFTVKTHRKNLYQKIGLRKIPDLIRFIENCGISRK